MAPRLLWHIKYHTRQTRKKLSKPLVHAAAFVLAWVYRVYMGLVWHTSRIESYGMGRASQAVRQHRNILVALWHDNAVLAGRSCRVFQPTTLASKSDIGEVITAVLKMQNFHVFRGGSSRGKARRKPVFGQLANHLKQRQDVLLALTVDGSHGPVKVCKPGIVGLSCETNTPIFAIHIVCKPVIRARSWDRTRFPLPFGKIVLVMDGPVQSTDGARDGDTFHTLCRQTQRLLEDTAERAERCLAGEPLPEPDPSLPLDPSYGNRDLRIGRSLLLPSEPPPRPRLLTED